MCYNVFGAKSYSFSVTTVDHLDGAMAQIMVSFTSGHYARSTSHSGPDRLVHLPSRHLHPDCAQQSTSFAQISGFAQRQVAEGKKACQRQPRDRRTRRAQYVVKPEPRSAPNGNALLSRRSFALDERRGEAFGFTVHRT